jgi:hypothetical protein
MDAQFWHFSQLCTHLFIHKYMHGIHTYELLFSADFIAILDSTEFSFDEFLFHLW